MRRGLPRDGAAQLLGGDKLPQYLDLLVTDGPRAGVEAGFCGALRHGINEALGSQGIHCAGIAETYQNQGYRLLLRDRERRDVWVTVSFDEMLKLGEEHGERGMFDRVLGLVVERCKAKILEMLGATENVVELAVREHCSGRA